MMQRNELPKRLFKFFSDTNFGLFVENLDFFIPGNYWDADYAKLTVKCYTDVETEQARRLALDYGAEIYD